MVLLVAVLGASSALAGPFGQGPPKQKSETACLWAGIYPTVLTPFCPGGGVDVLSLERQLHYELRDSVHGLLVLGTLGEGEYATTEERAQVIATAVRMAGPRVPVVVGIHTCNIEVAQAQMVQARELGAAAVLVKYLGNPKADAGTVLGFYATLNDLHLLPIFYYHYPSQTHLKLTPEDIARILWLPGVVGIKESTLDLREVEAHLCLTRGHGKVFLSGTALDLTQFLAIGGHGAMCPEAVLLPGPTVNAYMAWMQGHHEQARSIQEDLFCLTPILRSGPTPPAVARLMLMAAADHDLPVPMGHDQPQAKLKAALNCLGVPTPVGVKCPLPPLTPHDEERVKKAVCRLKAIDWTVAALKVPPVPYRQCPTEDEGGSLLKTGAFILGPGVGNDLLRSQGDGQPWLGH
jgi:4-hydroxy-tetrahydrodipicolinate synthase